MTGVLQAGSSVHRECVTNGLVHRPCTTTNLHHVHRRALPVHHQCTIVHRQQGAPVCTVCTGIFRYRGTVHTDDRPSPARESRHTETLANVWRK
jgi:hypothetical protein